MRWWHSKVLRTGSVRKIFNLYYGMDDMSCKPFIGYVSVDVSRAWPKKSLWSCTQIYRF